MSDANDVEALIEKGFDLLAQFEPAEALKIGKRLIRLGHTSGFEIAARARRDQDRPKRAASILAKGLRIAPNVRPLWALLGEIEWERKRLRESAQAFERALACPGEDDHPILLDLATVLAEMDEHARARTCLDRIVDPDPVLAFRAGLTRLGLLLETGELAAARALTDQLGTEVPEEISNQERAMLKAKTALIHHRLDADRQEVLEQAFLALEMAPGDPDALWLVRELDNSYSPASRRFILTVQGSAEITIDDETRIRGFMVPYDVVAETPEEALALIRRLRPEPERDSLTIADIRRKKKHPHVPKGVYWVGGTVFFEE